MRAAFGYGRHGRCPLLPPGRRWFLVSDAARRPSRPPRFLRYRTPRLKRGVRASVHQPQAQFLGQGEHHVFRLAMQLAHAGHACRARARSRAAGPCGHGAGRRVLRRRGPTRGRRPRPDRRERARRGVTPPSPTPPPPTPKPETRSPPLRPSRPGGFSARPRGALMGNPPSEEYARRLRVMGVDHAALTVDSKGSIVPGARRPAHTPPARR